MLILTVTSRGRVTLRQELLEHLGVKPGDRISVDLRPGGEAFIRADRQSRPIESLFGLLKRDGGRPLSLEEIDEVIKESCAGRIERRPAR